MGKWDAKIWVPVVVVVIIAVAFFASQRKIEKVPGLAFSRSPLSFQITPPQKNRKIGDRKDRSSDGGIDHTQFDAWDNRVEEYLESQNLKWSALSIDDLNQLLKLLGAPDDYQRNLKKIFDLNAEMIKHSGKNPPLYSAGRFFQRELAACRLKLDKIKRNK